MARRKFSEQERQHALNRTSWDVLRRSRAAQMVVDNQTAWRWVVQNAYFIKQAAMTGGPHWDLIQRCLGGHRTFGEAYHAGALGQVFTELALEIANDPTTYGYESKEAFREAVSTDPMLSEFYSRVDEALDEAGTQVAVASKLAERDMDAGNVPRSMREDAAAAERDAVAKLAAVDALKYPRRATVEAVYDANDPSIPLKDMRAAVEAELRAGRIDYQTAALWAGAVDDVTVEGMDVSKAEAMTPERHAVARAYKAVELRDAMAEGRLPSAPETLAYLQERHPRSSAPVKQSRLHASQEAKFQRWQKQSAAARREAVNEAYERIREANLNGIVLDDQGYIADAEMDPGYAEREGLTERFTDGGMTRRETMNATYDGALRTTPSEPLDEPAKPGSLHDTLSAAYDYHQQDGE